MSKILPYAKTYAALLGAICTALLGVYAADTTIGQVLTVVSVIATAVLTWSVPNLDPAAEHQAESVQPPGPVVDQYLDGMASSMYPPGRQADPIVDQDGEV